MQYLLPALLLTLCVGSGVFARYYSFHSGLSLKERKLLTALYALAAVVNIGVITLGMTLRGIDFAFNYLRFGGIVFSGVLTLVNIATLRRWFREQMFVFGIVLTCNYLLMSLPNLAITLVNATEPRQVLLIVVTMYLLVLLLTTYPLARLLKKTMAPFLHTDARDYWKWLWFLPTIYFVAKFMNLGGEHNGGGFAQVLGSLLTGFIMVTLCLLVSGDHARMMERQQMEEQLITQQRHYTELKDWVEYSRKLNHNLKHHVAAIRAFAANDDKAGLDVYCKDLLDRVGQISQVPYTGNVAADGVIYHYQQQAVKNAIQFQLAGTLRSQGIADIDLCALLGNALDNAVAGCLTLEKGRSISVISQAGENMLSIVVRNTFDGQIRQNENGILSSKRETAPGIGLKSMESICQRYNGSMQVRWDAESFTVMFLLPLN